MIQWSVVLLFIVSALAMPFSALAALLPLPYVLIAEWRGRVFIGRGVLSRLMAGWLLWIPISLACSQSVGNSLPQAAVLLCLPLGWLAGLAFYGRGHLRQQLEYFLPVLLLILTFWGVLQGPNTFTHKPQGPFNDPNTYAAVLNLLVLPVLARYLAVDLAKQAAWWRIGQLALLASVALVAFLTASRGATLAFVLVFPLLLWLARKHPDFKRKLALLTIVTLVSYLAAYITSGGLSVALRVVDTIEGGDPSRVMLFQSAWLMIQDHPWLGTGLGTFKLLYPQYRYSSETGTAGGWVHNDYLQLWLEAGLPMLLLMLGLVAWVIWMGWKTLRGGGNDALIRMGYLAAIAAILLHALVNFLFFFALISLVVGLYLARLSQFDAAPISAAQVSPAEARGKHCRAIRMASWGYALILGWLLLGQVAVEVFLDQARPIQQVLLKWNIAYPRYEVAYWISVLAPFHPTPQQVMGLELADGGLFSGGDRPMLDEALQRMEGSWQRVPCYLPYGSDALSAIHQYRDSSLHQRGLAIAQRNLDCNARHGLSYFYAGTYAATEDETLEWWRAGMAASSYLGEDLLLAGAILSRTTPGHEKALAALAEQMAQALRHLEANPGVRADQGFWAEVQHKLYRIAGRRYLELVPPPK